MGCGRGPQYPVEGPSLVCCFLCPPRDAGLVALWPLGQWQGYHNPIFLLPCWGWIQPWNGCVGSMKKPCSAVAVISGALWLTQDFCLLCSSLASDSYCHLPAENCWWQGELEPDWRLLGMEIWAISSACPAWVLEGFQCLLFPVPGDPALLQGTDFVLFLHSGLGSNLPGLHSHSPVCTRWCSWSTSSTL